MLMLAATPRELSAELYEYSSFTHFIKHDRSELEGD